MLSEEDHQLFFALRPVQVNRNAAINVFEHHNANAAGLLVGGMVRVLLELPGSHSEDYALALIAGTLEGPAYRGFSTNNQQETTTYLRLNLPRQLAALNGESFQLNSISNSAMSEQEFKSWLRLTRADGAPLLPTIEELRDIAARIRSIDATRGGRRGGAAAAAAAASAVTRSTEADTRQTQNTQQQQQQQRLYGDSVSATMQSLTAHHLHAAANGGSSGDVMANIASAAALGENPQRQLARQGLAAGGGDSNLIGGAVAAAPANPFAATTNTVIHTSSTTVALQSSAAPVTVAAESEMDRRVRQEIMNSLQTASTLFPRDPRAYRLSQLRLVERDMIEYLQQVRDEIASKQPNCVVCMDHVPSVILLPCRHEALCRLCAPTLGVCPVCRTVIREMFEPQEI